MAGDGIASALKDQGKAILIMISIAIIAILGMVVLVVFQTSLPNATALINTTIAGFLAGFALVGTFATVTMLIIVIKVVIGVVKGLR